LPSTIYAKCSPKSSIGRIDLFVRTIFDQSGFYDQIEKGASGNLWIQICPRSFNVQIYPGLALTQMALFDTSVKSEEKQQIVHLNTQLGGYQAKATNQVLDLSKLDHDSSLYFDPILPNIEFVLEKDKFYILATIEKININPMESAEMVPFTSSIGEFRCHKAGFFDPGFNAVGVLEICPYETIKVFNGQPIALLNYFQNKSLPLVLYGDANNNYQHQTGPQLAKYFAKPKKRSRAQIEFQDETMFVLHKFELLQKEITKLIKNIEWIDENESNFCLGIYLCDIKANGLEFYKETKQICEEIQAKGHCTNYEMYFSILQKMLYFREKKESK